MLATTIRLPTASDKLSEQNDDVSTLQPIQSFDDETLWRHTARIDYDDRRYVDQLPVAGSEMQWHIGRKSPIFTTPPLCFTPNLRTRIFCIRPTWALEQEEQREQLLPQLLARESRP